MIRGMELGELLMEGRFVGKESRQCAVRGRGLQWVVGGVGDVAGVSERAMILITVHD